MVHHCSSPLVLTTGPHHWSSAVFNHRLLHSVALHYKAPVEVNHITAVIPLYTGDEEMCSDCKPDERARGLWCLLPLCDVSRHSRSHLRSGWRWSRHQGWHSGAVSPRQMQSPVWKTKGFPVPGMSGRYLKFQFCFYCILPNWPTPYRYFSLVQHVYVTKALHSTFKEKVTKGVDLSKEDGQGTTANFITRYGEQSTACEEITTDGDGDDDGNGEGSDGNILLTPNTPNNMQVGNSPDLNQT